MRILLVSLVFTGLLTGCFASSHPKDNVGFASVPSISALNGTYRNLGEAGKHDHPRYLTAEIWPLERTLPHDSIDVVDVRATSDSALVVTALIGDRTVKQQSFVNGKDFDFRDGRLRVGKGWHSGDPASGALYVTNTSEEYGLDKKGQGKYKGTESVIGAMYLIIPVAVYGNTEVRFIRLKD